MHTRMHTACLHPYARTHARARTHTHTHTYTHTSVRTLIYSGATAHIQQCMCKCTVSTVHCPAARAHRQRRRHNRLSAHHTCIDAHKLTHISVRAHAHQNTHTRTGEQRCHPTTLVPCRPCAAGVCVCSCMCVCACVPMCLCVYICFVFLSAQCG